MSALSATLVHFPSFALSDILLFKRGYHYHLKQNLLSTTILFVGHSGGFRIHATTGKAPASASAPALATATSAARLSLPAYLIETLGLSEKEAHSASRHLLGIGSRRTQSNINTFITIKKSGNAISYLQNDSGLDLSSYQLKTLVAQYPKILSPGADLKKTCTPNIALLQNEFGFTKDKVVKLLFLYPRAFLLETEILKHRLVTIEQKWGISRDSGVFMRAIPVFCGVNDEKIESRCQVYRNFGISDSEILTLVRTSPGCIALSEAKIKKKFEFYMNELGYDPAYVVALGQLLMLSIKNRVLPRHRVVSLLKENLLFKSQYKLSSYLRMPEDKFVKKYILPYEKIIPNLRQVYNEGRSPYRKEEPLEEASEDESSH